MVSYQNSVVYVDSKSSSACVFRVIPGCNVVAHNKHIVT